MTSASIVRRRPHRALYLALGVLLLAACGSDEGSDPASDVRDTSAAGPDTDDSSVPDLDVDDTSIPDQSQDTDIAEEVDPTLPTLPGIRLTPLPAYTTDDVRVVLDIPGEAPDGQAVEHTFLWRKVLEEERVEGDTLPAAMTSRGETWTVEVMACIPAGCGPSATQSVTIENSAPSLSAARLDDHALFSDETARVWVDSSDLSDADDDALDFVARWRLDPSGETFEDRDALDLSLIAGVAGQTLTVEVAPVDEEGLEGEPIRLGPFEVAAPFERWEPVQPELAAAGVEDGVMLHDRRHDRLLYARAGQLWEADPQERPLRWSRLNPRPLSGGLPDLAGASALIDEAGERALFIGAIPRADGTMSPVMRVLALDLSERGREAWSEVAVDGLGPRAARQPGVVFDHVGGRVLVHGGLRPTGASEAQLYALNLEPSGAAWQVVSAGGAAPPALVDPVWVSSPASTTALLTGGQVVAGAELARNNETWFVDLDDMTFTRDASSAADVIGQSSVWPQGRGHVLSRTADPDALQLWTVDLDAAAITRATVEPPVMAMRSWLVVVPLDEGEAMVAGAWRRGGAIDDGGLGLYRVDFEADSWERAYLAGADAPLGLRGAALLHDEAGEALLATGGVFERDTGEVWRRDLAARTWSRVEVAPDPVAGLPPARRDANAVVLDGSLILIGGRDPESDATRTDTWRLTRDGAGEAWRWQRLDASSQITGTRAVVWQSACSDQALHLALPLSSDGTPDTSARWTLTCADVEAMTGCDWSQEATTWSGVTPYGAMGASLAGGGAVVVSDTSTGDFYLRMDAWTAPACASTGAWASLGTPSGAEQPAPRWRASFDRTAIADGGLELVMFGGLEIEPGPEPEVYDEAWLLRYTPSSGVIAWRRLELTGGVTPAARHDHVTVSSPSRSALFVAGGQAGADAPREDLWRLILPR